MTDLLLCPFCGEPAAKTEKYQAHGESYWRVRCDECWATSHGSYHLDEGGAVKEWNTRANLLGVPQEARTPAFEAMIANLVKLDKQRTPGPWRKSHEAIGAPGCVNNIPHHLPLVAECDTDFGMYKTLGSLQAGKNARFIVALENAWPKILAALALSRPNCEGTK